ncbi:hypothetical protein C8Q78DRAFT_1047816 [Trametes maxima]|nr:hypothetical protein C8Q78DRAFT_1047816 [Trametes maxima]
MTSTFTPSDIIDPTKERDWPANLGMLDWDRTGIVFTKRSLLEFLKYAGVTVDPNFTNIQKLPRYAKFGKLSAAEASSEASEAAGQSSEAAAVAPSESSVADDFKPTRRVRDPPGGRQHNIFGDNIDDDALAGAPPKPAVAVQESVEEESALRNKRTDTVAGLWDAPEDGGFKPTRRVRERPGGKDSISGLFGP